MKLFRQFDQSMRDQQRNKGRTGFGRRQDRQSALFRTNPEIVVAWGWEGEGQDNLPFDILIGWKTW